MMFRYIKWKFTIIRWKLSFLRDYLDGGFNIPSKKKVDKTPLVLPENSK
jgi:hypothetical protein